jgi:hypothetical protein
VAAFLSAPCFEGGAFAVKIPAVSCGNLQSYQPMGTEQTTSRRTVNVLSDVHFWVPALVLLGGLLLLKFLH